jgi:hypothetical protein
MSIKRWIRDWLGSDRLEVARTADTADIRPEDQVTISINNAMNGRVLSIRTYQPSRNNNRSDWINELYVVPEGDSLTDAVSILLLAKGLK